MGLFERLVGEEGPKIPVHQFAAGVHEQLRGELTAAQIEAAFNLSAGERNELDILLAQLAINPDNAESRQIFDDAVLLAEGGFYTKARVLQRLGL